MAKKKSAKRPVKKKSPTGSDDSPSKRGASKRGRSRQSKAQKTEMDRQGAKSPQQDLTKIEGIGPKTAQLLREHDITSFRTLAKTTPDQIREILAGAGGAHLRQSPETWPLQAQLAASGNWARLRKIQSEMVGGRATPEMMNARTKTLVKVDAGRRSALGQPQSVEWFPDGDQLYEEYVLREEQLKKQYARAQRARRKMKKILSEGEYGKTSDCVVAFRRSNKRIVSPLEYVISVSVRYKIDDETLEKSRISAIPSQCDGVTVNVTESRPYLLNARSVPTDRRGRFLSGNQDLDEEVFPPDASSYDETTLLGGIPCAMASESDNIGTLGICFKSGSKFYGIVNAHFADEDEEMVQPPDDRFGNDSENEIGKVEKSVFLRTPSGGGSVDAALIHLDPSNSSRSISDKLIDRSIDDKIGDQDVFFAANRIQDNLHVFKYGAATNHTIAKVANYSFDELTIKVGSQNATFRNIIQFEDPDGKTVVDDGDSGSALVTEIAEGFLVVGIVFAGEAGNSSIGYACHFADVMTELKPELDLPSSVLMSI